MPLVFLGERGAFARNEDGCGRLDIELLRVIALIDGDADAAARILVEKRIADGHVHERFAERQDKRFAVELDADLVSEDVAERAEVVTLNIRDERAERIVEPNDLAGDSFFF